MKKRIKLMAGTLALGMFLTGCKKELDIIVVRDNTEHTKQDFSTTDTNEVTTPTELIIQTPETTVEATITEPEIVEEPELSALAEQMTIRTPEFFIRKEEDINIETTPTEEPIEKENEELPENIIAYTTTAVNLRAVNNTKSIIIRELSPYETVYKIASCDNNWDLVQVGDTMGYICRDYLAYTDQTYENNHKYTLKNDIAVTTTELNFRSGPSTEYPVRKTLVTTRENELTEVNMVFKENEELRVVAEVDDDWLLVEYNGEFGYVHKGYTVSLLEKLQSTYPELGIEDLDLKKVVYSNSGLRIRRETNTESEIIRTLERYESLRVLGEYDDWYLIMTNEHEFGYVHSEYVTELDGKTTIIDKSEQRMYMYNDDERLTYTPVTTGKDSTPTDTGLFHIYYMDTTLYLNGDKDWSFHWMNYNNGEGIHDAWWRQVYGEDDYHNNGSNGCTNTPYAAVKTMYNNSYEGQRVLVHK